MTTKIVITPQDEARHAFDAENNVEPCRAIAERIAHDHHQLDEISHAIEDARALGEKRAAEENARLRATCQERDAEQGRLDAEIARLTTDRAKLIALLAEARGPQGESEERVAEWLRGRGYTVAVRAEPKP